MASNNNDKHTGKNNNKHLFYLNELSDYKVASDDPDVRGWKVKDSDNRVIGKVDNLLVNKNTERVVYLDVEVDSSIIEANHDPYGQPADSDVHEFINKDGENHIIIPVGLVRINDKDNDNKYVYTDRINHRTFAETKRMEKGSNVSRDYEVVVLDSYNRDRDNDRNTGSLGRDDNNRTGNTGVAGGTGTTRSDNDLGRDSGTRRTGNEGSITGASNRTGNNNLGSDATSKRTSDDSTLTGSSNRTGNDDLRGDSGGRRGGDDSLLTNSQRRGSDDFGRDTDSRSNNDSNRESARRVTDDRGNDTGRRVNDDLGRDSSTRDSDFNRDSNRVNTNTDSSLSGADSDRKNYDSLGDADRRSGDNDRNRYEDDESFYERREFDRSNFRRNNNNNNNS